MWINHIHFYLEDAQRWRDWFVETMGFSAITSHHDGVTLTEIVCCQDILFLLSSPLHSSSPVAQYLSLHPPGVVDLAFLVSDLETIAHQSNCVLQSHRGFKYCELVTPVQFKHTLIEGFGSNPVNPLTGLKLDYAPRVSPPWFTHIDHLVLNVEGGKLEMMVDWYEKVLGFERQQSFQIGTPFSALSSQVLIHPKTGIQLPINEPVDPNSQIQEFIELNRGSGIQHIALSTPNITRTCSQLSTTGLSFLHTPKSYYDHLPDLNISPQEYTQLQTQGILAEIQPTREGNISPVLLQIFTNPIFTTPTFFFELIERRHHAQGFGAGNFQALFEAIEREQLKRGLKLS